jgi:streptomycin 6-kinase
MSLPRPDRVLDRRLDILTEELGFDREKMLGWSIAQALLSAWWHLEDRTSGLDYALGCARILAGLLS